MIRTFFEETAKSLYKGFAVSLYYQMILEVSFIGRTDVCISFRNILIDIEGIGDEVSFVFLLD